MRWPRRLTDSSRRVSLRNHVPSTSLALLATSNLACLPLSPRCLFARAPRIDPAQQHPALHGNASSASRSAPIPNQDAGTKRLTRGPPPGTFVHSGPHGSFHRNLLRVNMPYDVQPAPPPSRLSCPRHRHAPVTAASYTATMTRPTEGAADR